MENKIANNNATRRDRFIRIAEIRVNRILDDFDNLAKCANKRNYEYEMADTQKIFYELEKKLKEIKSLFHSPDKKQKKRFQLK